MARIFSVIYNQNNRIDKMRLTERVASSKISLGPTRMTKMTMLSYITIPCSHEKKRLQHPLLSEKFKLPDFVARGEKSTRDSH
jgi:hypothetical protein